MDIEEIENAAESWLGVPMLSGVQVIGVISVQSYSTPRAFGGHDLDLLSAVANQAAIAIQNARLFEDTQNRARREQVLREITAKVHSSADAETILRTAVKEVSETLGRRAFLYLGDYSKSRVSDSTVGIPTIEAKNEPAEEVDSS
jgi:GAF domain-containing protein